MSNPIRVLIIDDHPLCRQGIRWSLEDATDIEVIGEAENGQEALKLTERLNPDVIFLLSQNITGYGQFEVDQRDLLALLDKLNPKNANGRRAAQINCIQFIDPDPLDTMRKIAEEHGGPNGYKFLDRSELGLGGR